ncbi:MAG: FAD-dependent oxidoreductase [Clostridia bacterium]|nr:FAD-dependent oxidoreductase [Clostridia bacterium]
MERLNFDAIIIGGGPAGITAGIYLKRAGKNVAILEGEMFGGQVATTSLVENYPGVGKIDGSSLALNMMADIKQSGATIIYENATKLHLEGEIKQVETKNYILEAKTVILAMGVRPRQINSELEKKFIGKGVSYCATCDGALYKNKDVAVIGGGNSAFIDAKYLSGVAKSVTLVHRSEKYRVSENVVEETKNLGVKLLPNYVLTNLVGENHLEKVVLKNTISGKEEELEVSGLFIAAGRVPNTELVAGVLNLDDNGFIISQDCKTNIDGVFACGDIRTKELRQIVTATSDGAICATLATFYLNRR